VSVRLTVEELRDVAAAAERAGLTPTGYRECREKTSTTLSRT